MPSHLNPSQILRRDTLISELREAACTYDKIAEVLQAKGLTKGRRPISRAAVYKLVKRACPHLLGNMKRRLEVERLVRTEETTEKIESILAVFDARAAP